LLAQLPALELTLVIGQYAHDYHLGEAQKTNLTESVRAWREFWPALLPLPHPSPRNNLWLRKNPWFEAKVVPALRRRLRTLLA
jgi:uracil-DNA glycosylase